MDFNIIDYFFPDDSHYMFVAEEKHAKYGLRPGCTYRAKQELQDGKWVTVGKPVLYDDPSIPGPSLRHMLPFTKVASHFVVQNDDGTTSVIENDSQTAVYVIDTIIAMAIISMIALAIVIAATA